MPEFLFSIGMDLNWKSKSSASRWESTSRYIFNVLISSSELAGRPRLKHLSSKYCLKVSEVLAMAISISNIIVTSVSNVSFGRVLNNRGRPDKLYEMTWYCGNKGILGGNMRLSDKLLIIEENKEEFIKSAYPIFLRSFVS